MNKITKLWHIYTKERYSAIKTNELMPFGTTGMDLEITIVSQMEITMISQTEKDKYISLICGTLKSMIQMNLFTKQKQTQNIENKFKISKGRRLGEAN